MMPFISVIVPVYRVEQYLKKCVDSLLVQTYDNFEILLIDDGSDDNCPQICDYYSSIDNRVKVFHKTNGGLSDARNYGVKHMNGSHAVFVDSDDYVTNTYLADLAHLVHEYDADLAVTKILAVNEDGVNLDFVKVTEKIEILSKTDALKRMLYRQGFGVSACGKIYKKKIIENCPYPNGIYYEDLATTYKIIENCKSIVYLDKSNYFYVQRSGSIVHRRPSQKELMGIDISEEIIAYMETYHPSVVPAAICRYNSKILEYIPNLLSNEYEDKTIFNYLKNKEKKYYKNIMEDSCIGNKIKMRSTAIMLGYLPTIILWKSVAFLKEIALHCKKW